MAPVAAIVPENTGIILALQRRPALFAHCHYWLFPSVKSDFTGTIEGNRHYSTAIIEGPILDT